MKKDKHRKRRLGRRVCVWCVRVFASIVLFSLLAVVALRFIPVYYTPLMFIRMYEGRKEGKEIKIKHSWTPIREIAQPLVLAVIASEDNRFMTHHGFDFEEIKMARDEARRGKRTRGASTISQQTAKNVFLWPGKSYVRKALEAYFTVLIELIWGKERIMEVYLNSIETGRGLYGAEAVAEDHFKKQAKDLTPSEAALIAATLPNPRRFDSANPSPYIRRRQALIMALMNKVGLIDIGYRR
ncbi:MAG: monofunctional biosynthetic peptidoglycan transglycosylase [Tannerellaceae bacterium]|jgi:monofunctional biosynthetic peptidoglycan transglycosylase|nr:monofunctional biosynthetic peptidoglycan transglycosylase [Tannerellaceae bacterium]